jgi:hypothetical protein
MSPEKFVPFHFKDLTMYGFYTPILILQAFCVYHAYRNNAEQRWYWLIVFFPLIGCLIYLFHNFYNRRTVSTLAEGMKEVVNSNYKIEQLEKALRFSDNITNKVNLADAYIKFKRYEDAINLYRSCQVGFMADDGSLRMKLLLAYFLNQDYSSAVEIGSSLEKEKSFKNSDERVAFAWSLHFAGQTDLAEKTFADMDKSFTNYQHRMEYAKFLLKIDRQEDAKSKLSDLIEEFEHMKGPERRLKKDTMREARDLYANLVKA